MVKMRDDPGECKHPVLEKVYLQRLFRDIPLILLCLLAVQATARAEDQAPTVYVTKTGTKYHVANCGYLRDSSIPIKLSEAVKLYTLCARCNPPTIAAPKTESPKTTEPTKADQQTDKGQVLTIFTLKDGTRVNAVQVTAGKDAYTVKTADDKMQVILKADVKKIDAPSENSQTPPAP